jgi:hypothetical protein
VARGGEQREEKWMAKRREVGGELKEMIGYVREASG